MERERRHKRVRTKISGTPECPRLCVFRSNTNVYAQVIDDVAGVTLVSSSTLELKIKKGGNIEAAKEVGKDVAEKCHFAPTTVYNFEHCSGKYTDVFTRPGNAKIMIRALYECIDEKLNNLFVNNKKISQSGCFTHFPKPKLRISMIIFKMIVYQRKENKINIF